MGHRSYLYLNKKDEEDFYAFEANNSLPFFWLTLIDNHSLLTATDYWKSYEVYESLHTEEETADYFKDKTLNIVIDYQTFENNSSVGKTFLASNYPETIPLYNAFIKAIKTNFEISDKLEIEIIQLSAFFESLDSFIKTLNNEINAIKNNDHKSITFLDTKNLISSGTGFESISLKEFSDSPAYQEALKDSSHETIVNNEVPPKAAFNKDLLILSIAITLICPFVTYLIFKGFKKESFTIAVIALGIANIFWYVIGILGIKKQLVAYKKRV